MIEADPVAFGEAGPVVTGPTGLPIIAPRDVAFGRPTGFVPLDPQPSFVDPDPVRALRDALRPALRRAPCVIAFSGGRDSSILLAVAAHLAAGEGLDPPIAVTFRYPGDHAADETRWQDLLIAHLRAAGHELGWVRRDVTDELDIVGPLTAPVLRAHGGPVFPAAVGNTALLATYATGGTLVTGNFGDEVLGGHRAAVLRTVVRRRGRGITAAGWRYAADCASPAWIRSRWGGSDQVDRDWLRPAVRREVTAEELRSEAARPLRWDHSVRWALAPRAVEIGDRTRAMIAGDHGCRLIDPLGAPGFVASFAKFGGRWGRLTRTAATRLLAAGLLPDAIIERRDKASFNTSRFGPPSQQFAREWDGRGLDESMVDPEALRAIWLADAPHAATAMLLQQAWSATRTAAQ